MCGGRSRRNGQEPLILSTAEIYFVSLASGCVAVLGGVTFTVPFTGKQVTAPLRTFAFLPRRRRDSKTARPFCRF